MGDDLAAAIHPTGGANAPTQMRSIVFVGLSITSSWGNGHATTYRALSKALHLRGHQVTFLERDTPWYASHRDLPHAEFCDTHLYADLEDLARNHAERVTAADAVIVGSFVPEGVAVTEWVLKQARGVTAFYDIDTPVTLAKLRRGDTEYLSAELIPQFDLYLSFTGGPTLELLEDQYRARRARPLYCSVDPELYRPVEQEREWELGYMGTYSQDRQPGLEELLLKPARATTDKRFVVAGPGYPDVNAWPPHVEHIEHLPPEKHCAFYNGQRFTLNITRSDMRAAGHAPSVRLFEAAACATPIISDAWAGLGSLFAIDKEILVARTASDVVEYLNDLPDEARRAIGMRARDAVLCNHTAMHRAVELETHLQEASN